MNDILNFFVETDNQIKKFIKETQTEIKKIETNVLDIGKKVINPFRN